MVTAIDNALRSEDLLGAQKDTMELGSGSKFLKMCLNKLHKEFGRHIKACTFGHGHDFRNWMNNKHKGVWKGMNCFVGNCADIKTEKTFLCHAVLPYYVEWLVYLKKEVCC